MLSMIRKKDISSRSALIDCMRGFVVTSMVLYHGMWDLVNLFGIPADWFYGIRGFLWQQATCCAFIVLSGFCAAFGKHTLKRGCMLLGMGAMVSVATLFFMPEEVILFGVLTLIGSCMVFVHVIKKWLNRIPVRVGLIVSFCLFIFTRNVNNGTVGICFVELAELPRELYLNHFTAYLGFPHQSFWSTDYFSIIPWMFLFLSGFFLFGICGEKVLSVRWKGIPILNLIGRQALLIYVFHQPVIYGLLLSWKYIM